MPLASAREKEEDIMNANPAATIVLVHGGFVDGSGWRPLYDLLTQDGYHVAVVQNPTLSLQGDAAATRLIIDAQDGPVVLVGHSYGGAVISEAGTDQKVAALVYICAFAPDKDESVNTLIAGFPADGPQPPILPPRDGFLFLDRDKFHASFAADVPADLAAFMADSQVPWGVDALGGPVTEPAWRTKPSWYMVTTEDRMIPPAAQRTMSQRAGSTVVEVAASHSVYVSQPDAVAGLIKQAVSAVAAQRYIAAPVSMAQITTRHPGRGCGVRYPSRGQGRRPGRFREIVTGGPTRTVNVPPRARRCERRRGKIYSSASAWSWACRVGSCSDATVRLWPGVRFRPRLLLFGWLLGPRR